MGQPLPNTDPAPAPADPGGIPPAPVPTPPAPVPAPVPFNPATLDPAARAYLDQQIADANHKARTQARDNAAEQAKKDLLTTLAKALGQNDAPTDPAQLTQQLTQTGQQNRQLQIQNALLGAAYKAGADGDLMTAVLTYNGKLSGLDPTAPDFAAQVQALVTSEMAANPRLALNAAPTPPSPAAGGANSPGMASGAPTDKITMEQLKAMTPDEIDAALKAGKLKHLM